jgi:hypothetical protein
VISADRIVLIKSDFSTNGISLAIPYASMYSRNERTDIVTSIGVGIRSTTVKPLRLSGRTLEKLLAVITYSEIPSVES